MKRLKEIELKTWFQIAIALILAPGVIKGVYYVGVGVGRALARLFG